MSKLGVVSLGLAVVFLVAIRFHERDHQQTLATEKRACEEKVTEAEEFWPGKPMNFGHLREEPYRVAAAFAISTHPYRLGVVVDSRGNHIFVSSLPGQFEGGEEFIFLRTPDGYRTTLINRK